MADFGDESGSELLRSSERLTELFLRTAFYGRRGSARSGSDQNATKTDKQLRLDAATVKAARETPFTPGEKGNPLLEFTTVEWDPRGTIVTDPLARRDIPFNVVDISEGKLGIEVAPAAAPALSRIAETYIKNGHLSMDRFPNLEAFNKRAYAERGAEGLPLSPDEAAAVYTMNYGIDAVEIARSQQGITSEGMKDYELAYGLNGQGVNTPTPRETPAIRYADGEVGWMAVDVDDLKEAYGLRDLLKSQGVEAEAWRGKDGVAHVVCSEEMMQACTSMTDVESWVKSPAGEQAVMQAAASGLEKVDEIDSVHQSMEECSKKAETERKLGSEHAGSVDRIEVTQRAQELAKELKVEQGHTIPNPMKAR